MSKPRRQANCLIIAGDEVILAVDSRIRNHPTPDLDDATRVRGEGGAIRDWAAA